MSYTEARGPSLKNSRGKELHHISIHGGDEPNTYVVAHHSREDDPEPEYHTFSDGISMIQHVAHHAGVSEPERTILPDPADIPNLEGRSRG